MFECTDTTVGFFDSSSSSQPTYNITNVTPDRAYNANSTTVAELADVLGTVVADLRAYGLVL